MSENPLVNFDTPEKFQETIESAQQLYLENIEREAYKVFDDIKLNKPIFQDFLNFICEHPDPAACVSEFSELFNASYSRLKSQEVFNPQEILFFDELNKYFSQITPGSEEKSPENLFMQFLEETTFDDNNEDYFMINYPFFRLLCFYFDQCQIQLNLLLKQDPKRGFLILKQFNRVKVLRDKFISHNIIKGKSEPGKFGLQDQINEVVKSYGKDYQSIFLFYFYQIDIDDDENITAEDRDALFNQLIQKMTKEFKDKADKGNGIETKDFTIDDKDCIYEPYVYLGFAFSNFENVKKLNLNEDKRGDSSSNSIKYINNAIINFCNVGYYREARYTFCQYFIPIVIKLATNLEETGNWFDSLQNFQEPESLLERL